MKNLVVDYYDDPTNDTIYIKLTEWNELGGKRGIRFRITYENLDRLMVYLAEGQEYPVRRICSGTNNV